MIRISTILTFPNSHLKNGELSPQDLKNFPYKLKNAITTLNTTIIVLGLFSIPLWAVGEYMGWG